MPAQGVDAWVERRVRAPRRIGRQRAGDQRRVEQRLRLGQRRDGVGGRELRAVQQCQPFLGAQHEGLQPGRCQRRRRRHALAAEHRLADAEHGRAHVRQWRQVARCAHRALRRDHRQHAAPEHGFQERQRRRSDSGCALRQAGDLQRQHQPHHGVRHGLADPCRMRQHDVTLQRLQIVRRDAHAGELAEAGVDSINRVAPRHDRRDGGGAALHGGPAGRVERGIGAAVDVAPGAEGNRAGGQDHRRILAQTRRPAERCRIRSAKRRARSG